MCLSAFCCDSFTEKKLNHSPVQRRSSLDQDEFTRADAETTTATCVCGERVGETRGGLIFRRTTPVGLGNIGRVVGDEGGGRRRRLPEQRLLPPCTNTATSETERRRQKAPGGGTHVGERQSNFSHQSKRKERCCCCCCDPETQPRASDGTSRLISRCPGEERRLTE